jgi:FkbM family methyltransferase
MRKIIKTTVSNIGASARKILSRNLPAAGRLYGLLQQAGFHVSLGPEPKIALLRSFGISCVLDIGANRGQFGRDLRLVGYDGKIVSFEPVNEPYQKLKEATKRDGKWFAVQLAIGDRDEHSTIHVSTATEFSSLLTQTEYCIANYPDYAKVFADQVVSVKRLDDVFRDYVGADDEVLLKIDTQGFERDVLNGARGVLPLIRAVHLEVSFERLYQGEATAAEMIERLSSDGFTLVLLAPLLQAHMLDARNISQADALFVRLP